MELFALFANPLAARSRGMRGSYRYKCVDRMRGRSIDSVSLPGGFGSANPRTPPIFNDADLQPAFSAHCHRVWPSAISNGDPVFIIRVVLDWSIIILACLATAPLRAAKALQPRAVPLVTTDPYFSIWSFAGHLTDDVTRHWTGTPQSLESAIRVDGATYRISCRSVRVRCPRRPVP